jgi:hypothetical protein
MAASELSIRFPAGMMREHQPIQRRSALIEANTRQ